MVKKDANRNDEASDRVLQIPGFNELLATKDIGDDHDNDLTHGDVIDSDNDIQSFIATQPRTFLLIGPSGSGKTTYCREFLMQDLQNNYYCIVISGAMTESQYKSMFPPSIKRKAEEGTRFLNPFFGIGFPQNSNYDDDNAHGADRLNSTLKEVRRVVTEITSASKLSSTSANTINSMQTSSANRGGHAGSKHFRNSAFYTGACVIVDSLTELLLLFDEVALLRFVTDLCLLLKRFEMNAIFTLAGLLPSSSLLSTTTTITSSTDSSVSIPAAETSTTIASLSSFLNVLSPFFDGILQTNIDQDQEKKHSNSKNQRTESMTRSIRLLSIKGLPFHNPKWTKFKLNRHDRIVFGEIPSTLLNCTMCGKQIMGTPIMSSEFAFDSSSCVETYRRLVGIYGPSVSAIGGLPSQVVNMNFFFVDIVGLSNPELSVRRQIEKIEVLNSLIQSCSAFAKTKQATIVLPTGDGMAIGFYSDPESPLKLSIELHRKINEYNNSQSNIDHGKSSEIIEDEDPPSSARPTANREGTDKYRGLGIRIGLSSGPIFIVNDIKGNQNVWGPGIILARRVMDLGDNMHILISGNLADSLIALRDEYKTIIKSIGQYNIKHGQMIKLYSAFSDNFRNPDIPTKLLL